MNFLVKMFKKLFSFFASSKFVLVMALLINIIVIILLTIFVSSFSYLYVSIFSLLVTFCLISFSKDPIVYKFSWLIAMVVLPLVGACLFIYFKSGRISKKTIKKWQDMLVRNWESIQEYYDKTNEKILKPNQQKTARYILNSSYMPIFTHNDVKYFPCGEEFFEDFFCELEKAKNYIYLEYFIIKKGKIWDRLIKILEQKADEGVEVKMMYDDFGSIDVFTHKDKKEFKKHNIEFVAFNKINAILSRFTNYRDHRKIAIIDGKVAYTGGLNLADEYANIIERFGYWKDNAIKIQGDAIYGLLVLFATSWEISTDRQISALRLKAPDEKEWGNARDLVQVFGSGPMATEPFSKNNYTNLIYSAQKSLYISTPYFLLDEETKQALKLASQSGVDVRIILPGIPDKKLIYDIGKTFYAELIKAGVKIYEMKRGFVHAKMIVVDEDFVSLGTVNFDFRSLYLHFEDTAMIYQSKAIASVIDDFYDLFDECALISVEDTKSKNIFKNLVVKIAKTFLPLL